MKHFLLFFCQLLAFGAIAQTSDSVLVAAPTPDKVFALYDVEKQPVFPGGESELYKFLAQSVKYPPEARKNKIQGLVVCEFTIKKDGVVSDINLIRDIGHGCGTEVTRLLKIMPQWQAAEFQGKAVSVRYTLPFKFKLE